MEAAQEGQPTAGASSREPTTSTADPTTPGSATATDVAAAAPPHAHRRLRLDRRAFLVAGGGIVVLGGTALAAKRLHLLSTVEQKVYRRLGYTPLPAPHPQPLPDGPLSTPRDTLIFDGKLAAGWADYSWGKRRLPDPSVQYDGKPVISFQLENWGGLQLHAPAFDTTGFGYLQCWVRGAQNGGQVAYVALLGAAGSSTPHATLGDYTRGGGIAAGTWRLVRIPLAVLGAESLSASGVVMQAGATQSQGTIYLADLRIVYHPNLRPPLVMRSWAFDLATITLAFDLPMEDASAATASDYLVAVAAGATDASYATALAPLSARYHADARTVSLALPKSLRPNGTYVVTLGAIRDKLGEQTAQGTRTEVQVTRQPLTLALDVAAQRRVISPEIYGMANVSTQAAADLGVRLLRWGGNAVTRYNWKLGNAFSAARDYFFANGNYGNVSAEARQPSGVADQFIASAHAGGIGTLLTIPTIGWVARDDNPSSASVNVPARGGPPLKPNGDAIAGYDPTANRQRTCVPSRARKGTAFSDPPDRADPTVAQDEWVYHLTRRFGMAAEGGVRYYAMDNEPDLWAYTHTDIQPAQLSYNQMRDRFLDYANAIKDVDASAQITGPASWGWTNYFYSPLDAGGDNYRSHADRGAHQDMPFLAWWLAELRRHDETHGRRSLDVLDLHFYPQGGEYSDDASVEMAARRLRSSRALWDPTYADESWIGEPVRLIPRMREWADLNYPGTKIALTEWNWGAEKTTNGALALAQTLGIFARAGLDIACHWGGLDAGSPGYAAFKLFGNYDGAGSGFLGTGFAAESSNRDLLTSYAAQTSADGALLLMVINASRDSDLTPALRLAHAPRRPQVARSWRLWPEDEAHVIRGPDVDLRADGDALTLPFTFPASSVTLLRLEPGT